MLQIKRGDATGLWVSIPYLGQWCDMQKSSFDLSSTGYKVHSLNYTKKVPLQIGTQMPSMPQ